jgi:Flp pilus assembly protein TadG
MTARQGHMPRRRPWRVGRRGVAAVEFAMIAPILIMLFGGAVDLGRGIERGIRLETAARAGAQYAILKPNDQTGILNAVVTSLTGVSGASVTVLQIVCNCPDANGAPAGSTSASECSNTCATGLARYRTITVSAPFTPVFPTSNYVPWNRLGTISRNVVARL